MAGVPSPESTQRRFRLVVVVVSIVAAVVGSVLLATKGSGSSVTTRGVTATLRVPSNPGSVAAGRDALWLALTDTRKPVRDRPLLQLDLTSGAIERRIIVGGQARYLAHVGDRLLATVEHVGGSGSGPGLIVAFDWRSGRVLARRQFSTVVGPLAVDGKNLLALQVKPAALLRLDSVTLLPKAAPLSLSPGETPGLAVGGGYVWVTASDEAELLRIDPETDAIKRVHVGGVPVNVAFVAGSVWIADRGRGEVNRLEPRTLRSVGKRVGVGGEPAWLVNGSHYLFVGDSLEGTVTRIDVTSGQVTGPPVRVAPPVKGGPGLALASAGDSVWVSSFASSSLTRVSATSTAPAPRAVIASSRPTAAVGGRKLPPGGKVIARIPLGRGAPPPLGGGGFAVGEGAVWAMSDAESTLMRIDPATNTVVAKIKASPPESVAAGAGAVWLSYPSENVVRRIDPRTNKVTATIRVVPQPTGLAVAPGAVWVAAAGGPSIARIDPATNRVVATLRLGPRAACCSEHMSLTAGPGAVWVAVPNANKIVRVDPARNRVVTTVKLPYTPCAFLVADRLGVWSAGGGCADVVARIDARTNRVATKVYEPHAVGLGLFHGSVWTAVIDSANVDRIDPRTGLVARLHVGGTPVRLGVGFGSIWVNDDNGRVLRIQPQG
jgi:DNA-binding beta-propeller fold protein YncE